MLALLLESALRSLLLGAAVWLGLMATTDLRAVLKGVLQDHLRLDARVLGTTVFPGSDDVKPMAGLV